MMRMSTFLGGSLLLLAGPFVAHAQVPVFIDNFYNPCGGDGSNEFLVGEVSGAQPFNPMDLYYFVSASSGGVGGVDSVYQDAFCGAAGATGNGSSACNAAGWTKTVGVGGASWRILDYAVAGDQPTVDAVVARLNAQQSLCTGGCTGTTFVAPDALTGTIPAGADFIFCISTAINDTNTYNPSDLIDFCSFCGNGPVYVIVASFPPGNSGLIVNTGTASVTRYVSIAYNFGGVTGVAEIYSYVHTPPPSSVTLNNYYQIIPQGPNALDNTTAVNTSSGTCALSAVVLPLSVYGFSAGRDGNDVVLTWTAASVQNVLGFEIERSSDGITFSKAGTVSLMDGTGQRYRFTDLAAPSSALYYRLRQLNLDQSAEYSHTVFLSSLNARVAAVIYPNPSGGLLNIRDAAGCRSYVLYDASGRQRQSGSGAGPDFKIDLQQVPAGFYWLELVYENGKRERSALARE